MGRRDGCRDYRGGPFKTLSLLKAETYYRYQIMLHTRSMSKLSHALAKMVAGLTLPDEVTMAVDIDPVNWF